MVRTTRNNGRLRFIHGMVLFELLSLLFAFGLIFEKRPIQGVGWASAGVMLFLSASWSGMLDITICAIGMTAFVAPWFFADENKYSKFSFMERSTSKDWFCGHPLWL